MKTLHPINPFTLETAGEYSMQDFPEIRKRISAARASFEAWKRIEPGQRVEWLRAGLQYFEANRSAIAKDITAQMGKPIWQAENELKGFFERSEYLLDIAEATLRPEILPPKPGFLRRIEHAPLGVVFVIAAWNYPLLIAGNGVLTALLAGNAVLLKHSSLTPAVGEHFARAFGRLGPCDKLLQAVVIDHPSAEKTIQEGDIDHVIFTGSVEGGRAIQRSAASRSVPGRFLDCNLELGGKDGAFVAEDADVAKAAADLVDGAMYNAGQSCCGIERVYVHRAVHDEFLERCRGLVAEYVLGNPLEHKTTLGPLASAKAARTMAEQVGEAKSKGARVLHGGDVRTLGKGVFFEPTLLAGVDHSMAVMREENFGPILPVMAVRDEGEAFRLMADSPYGLTSVIYSRDIDLANRFAAEMDTGTVFLNRCDYLDPALPWTGVRASGRGTTLSKFGFYGLTRRKAIHFRLPE